MSVTLTHSYIMSVTLTHSYARVWHSLTVTLSVRLTHSYARVWHSLTVTLSVRLTHTWVTTAGSLTVMLWVWGSLTLELPLQAHSQLCYGCEAHSCIIYVEMDIDDVFQLYICLSSHNTGIAKRRSPACRQGCEPAWVCTSTLPAWADTLPIHHLSLWLSYLLKKGLFSRLLEVYIYIHSLHDSCWRLRSLDHLTPWQEVQKVRGSKVSWFSLLAWLCLYSYTCEPGMVQCYTGIWQV